MAKTLEQNRIESINKWAASKIKALNESIKNQKLAAAISSISGGQAISFTGLLDVKTSFDPTGAPSYVVPIYDTIPLNADGLLTVSEATVNLGPGFEASITVKSFVGSADQTFLWLGPGSPALFTPFRYLEIDVTVGTTTLFFYSEADFSDFETTSIQYNYILADNLHFFKTKLNASDVYDDEVTSLIINFSGDITTNTSNFTKLNGKNVVYVSANDTPANNGQALLDTYGSLLYATPNGEALGPNNRLKIVLAPGLYDLDGLSNLNISYNYIDVVSLTGDCDVIITGKTNTISVAASDVYIKGINTGGKNFIVSGGYAGYTIENCVGGDLSFGGDDTGMSPQTIGGNFINCTGGNKSFAGNGGVANGIFTNCTAGGNSFGGSGGTANGIFTNCTAGAGSFANDIGSVASGIFKNCVASDNSFGGKTGTASGTFTDCVAGNNSFGGTASGTFERCIADASSFGANTQLSGKLYYCRKIFGSGPFPAPVGLGQIYFSVDGDGAPKT